MKKTLSIVLAMAMVVAMFAAVALVPTGSGNTDAFKLIGIKVTDSAGYTNPFIAVDNAAALNENTTAYVQIEFNLKGVDASKYNAPKVGNYETLVTSSTLDLTYAKATFRTQTINADDSIGAVQTAMPVGNFLAPSFDSAKNEFKIILNVAGAQPAKDKTIKFLASFIGVTKPATAGEVTAKMAVGGTKFATVISLTETYNVGSGILVVYDAAGAAKYTIVCRDSNAIHTYGVYLGEAKPTAGMFDNSKYLFDYLQDNATSKFVAIAYRVDGRVANPATALGFTYDGKIVYYGLDDKLGTSDDIDLTTKVTDCNAFFGFSFAYNNAVKDSNFEDKTVGNPVIVTDTYAYVTATVADGDEDVDIAPTGDFSANIVIVMAASAVLAAAALAFVAKKARD